MRKLVICAFVAGFTVSGCTRAADTTATLAGDGKVQENGAATPAGGVSSVSAPVDRTTTRAQLLEVTIPAGTELPVILDTSVDSSTSSVEQPVRAHLSRAVTIAGQSVLAEGSRISGVVTEATRAGKVKGRARVALRFDSVVPAGSDERHRIQTATIGRTAEATTKEDALKIGAPAAGGAIIGAIVGGSKGAAIGATAGGGAGTAVVLSTRGNEISLPAGTALRVRLTEPLTLQIDN